MKKEEIINGLKFTVDMFLFDPSTGEEYTEPRNDMDKTTIDACRGAIELLEQELKAGHWIVLNDRYNKCSECGFHYDMWNNRTERLPRIFNYCPICGAKMIESENKE
jgi:hypothetical protein